MGRESSHYKLKVKLKCMGTGRCMDEANLLSMFFIPDCHLVSDEDGCSEVFLPTDSDYDSSDAFSPRDLDLVYSSAQDLSHQTVLALSGSAPDVLQMHELKPSACSIDMFETDSCTQDLEDLSLSNYSSKSSEKTSRYKRKLISRSQPQRSCFSGSHRWLRAQSENQTTTLSEGLYTRQSDLDLPLELPMSFPYTSYSIDDWKRTNQESKPNVHRIFVESCSTTSPKKDNTQWPEDDEDGHGGSGVPQEVDSDDQTNEQVSEILSSAL